MDGILFMRLKECAQSTQRGCGDTRLPRAYARLHGLGYLTHHGPDRASRGRPPIQGGPGASGPGYQRGQRNPF